MTTSLALGRKPADPSRRRIRLSAPVSPAYTPPAAVDYYSALPADLWGMDGNDQVGDCTIAERDHSTKALQKAAGNPIVASTTAECLAAYSAITGYDPSDPNSDQGAIMQDVYEYQRKNGITLGGAPNKILLFAELNIRNTDLIKWALDQFGAIGLGMDFPDSAMDQFDRGLPWSVVAGARSEGGHAISLVGYDKGYWYVVTWGRVQKMTPAFFTRYMAEAWVALDEDFVNTNSGNTPLGATLYAMGLQFQVVTGKPNPVPAPVDPTPAPVPTPIESDPNPFPIADVQPWLDSPHGWSKATKAAKAVRAWWSKEKAA